MRVLYEPTTILAIAAVTTFAGDVMAANAAKSQAGAEAAFLETQARQEEIAATRELRDTDKEKKRFLARTRAVLAAQGDTTGSTALSTLSESAGEFGIRSERIRQDRDVARKSLLSRSTNVRRVGAAERRAGLVKAAGNLGVRTAKAMD